MRITLIGDFSTPDEARKVMSNQLYKELKKLDNHLQILKIHIRNISLKEISKIRAFAPDIIHYIPGASPISFLITKIIQKLSKNSRSLMFSALHPFYNPFYSPYYFITNLTRPIIPLIKTDLVLVQSDSA